MSNAPRRRRSLATLAATTAVVVGGALLVAGPVHAVENVDTIDLGTLTDSRGIDVTPDGSLIFVADQVADEVAVVDAITHAVITTVAVGDEPINLTVSPDGSIVYVVNSADNSVSVIDVATLTLVGGQIPVSNFPLEVAFSPDGTTAFVAGYGANEIKVIDVATATVTDTVTGTPDPQSVRVSPDGSTLWIAGASRVTPMDIATLTLGTQIFSSPPSQIRYLDLSPDGSLLVAGGDSADKVYFIDTATETVIDEVEVGESAYGLAFNLDGTRLFVGLSSTGILEIDPATATIVGTIASGIGPNSIAMSPTGDFGYASNATNGEITVFGDPVRRTTGTNRYETAVKISQQAYPGGAPVVYVATGTDYPDALAAGPAAAKKGGPLLLTENTSLPAAVKAEIQRLDPASIIVVGGPTRVSEGVKAELETIAPTTRITGSNRFETSRFIAQDAFASGTATHVYIATGLNFPDALTAGAAGATFGAPVLLVNGLLNTVDDDTLNSLGNLGAVTVSVVGGPNMVSDGILTQLQGILGSGNVQRLTGLNRFETGLVINEDAFLGETPVRALLATGLIFPDALAASAWAGRIQAPLYITQTACVPQEILDHMTLLGVKQVTLVGGPDRLTQAVFDLTPC
jgi:YVTN family beta-propeller protein